VLLTFFYKINKNKIKKKDINHIIIKMKKEVKILGLSYSQSQSGSYVVVLSEKKGKRKLPVVIKPSDAQQIALKIEGVKSARPLTHDLFKTITDCYGIDIQEVYIHTVLEGIFYTKLVTHNGIEDVEIECTAGDGIALAMVYQCPIFADKEVLDSSGIFVNDDGSQMSQDEIDTDEIEDEDDEEVSTKKSKRVVSIEDLEHMMNDAISNEEYEIAADIRDRINKLKEEK
jgi:bifunctional DNase/RNase